MYRYMCIYYAHAYVCVHTLKERLVHYSLMEDNASSRYYKLTTKNPKARNIYFLGKLLVTELPQDLKNYSLLSMFHSAL